MSKRIQGDIDTLAWPNQWHTDMTLGEALDVLRTSYACACIGPPMPSPRGTPCWCRLVIGQAAALHRGAHIAANLILTAYDQRKAARTR